MSSSAKSLALSEVSRSGGPEPGWTRKRSPGSVAVAASTARREPSAEAVNAITSWSARVRLRDLARRDVDRHQVGPAPLGRHVDDRRLIAAPDRHRPGRAARRVLVAGEPGADVAVEAGGEIPRHGAGRGVDHVQVGLSEGTRGLAERAAKREPLAVGADRQVLDRTGDARDLPDRSPLGRNDIDRAAVRAMVGLEVAIREEIELPGVAGPGGLGLRRTGRSSAAAARARRRRASRPVRERGSSRGGWDGGRRDSPRYRGGIRPA